MYTFMNVLHAGTSCKNADHISHAFAVILHDTSTYANTISLGVGACINHISLGVGALRLKDAACTLYTSGDLSP